MVKVRHAVKVAADGTIDVAGWVQQICAEYVHVDATQLEASCQALTTRFNEHTATGLEFADLVASLNMDTASIVAALFYRPLRKAEMSRFDLVDIIGSAGADLAMAVVNTGDSSLLELSNTRILSSEARDQVENIRRMLITMIDDPRVAVLKIAERVVALRLAKNASPERRLRIADEANKVFAPLAGRLGIWQLKWELEDLALRYLEPDAYMSIAKHLAGRRELREQQIQTLVKEVQQACQTQGISAQVQGRAKHIYSIWRKMRSKNIDFNEVYDVRAVRVIVPDIAACYAALGTIHTHWRHIPHEFDDYIANPKENGYRSIHTAVVDESGQTFEAQIRTHEMHEESELGVCAHWTYKEDPIADDGGYTDKMNWLRAVVEWQEELGGSRTLSDQLATRLRQERIFINTPKGHVLDLMSGATALDFAYRVHTEVGHHCIGARVNDRVVALNTPLANGQRVEILDSPDATPRREWLNLDLGYVYTSRARSKIHGWFKSQDEEVNRKAGETMVDGMLDRLNLRAPNTYELRSIADRLHFKTVDLMFVGLALAECQLRDILEVYLRVASLDVASQLSLLPDESQTDKTYKLKIVASNRDGLLLDVIRLLSEKQLSLHSASGTASTDGKALLDVEVTLTDLVALSVLIDQIRQIPDILDVRRQEIY